MSKFDTGLRFTDILFGFVIRELFLRLQNWGELEPFVRWQLVAAAVLVLGSWIGFRRSLNRSTWEVKFFNLPLMRFVLDQLMVILYFRIAVLTPQGTTEETMTADALVNETAQTLFFIFALYLIWDALALWMARAKERAWPADREQQPAWKYPKLDEEKKAPVEPRQPAVLDWPGFVITAVALATFAGFYFVFDSKVFDNDGAVAFFLVAAGLLLLYRFAKEVKSSFIASH